MIRRTIGQIAEMLELGRDRLRSAAEDVEVHGVSTDTRTIRPGNLYIPIRGPRFNGHDYVRQAVDAGAVAALWSADEPDAPEGVPLLIVGDTVAALQQLAGAYRRQLRTRVVGITGSNGKTSTKDILAGLLGTAFRTQKTAGNLNNELGVPLTLLSLAEETEMAVVEMGMSGLREIALLSSLARPDVAIITSVSEVHLADLLTRERIAQAKLEILEGLAPGGFFIYNADNPLLTDRLALLTPDADLLAFGEAARHDLYPASWTMNEAGITFEVNDPVYGPLFLPMLGKHQLLNALGAIAAARHLGLSPEQIRQGLLRVEATGMRQEVAYAGKLMMINDTYKSNPPSLRAALDTLMSLQPHKRKIAVIGSMVELGEESDALHTAIGEGLDPQRLDRVLTIGEAAARIADAAARRFPAGAVKAFAENQRAALLAALLAEADSDCIVLVKGSRSLKLEELVTEVLARVGEGEGVR
ncbi:UDP-N-acetylmuramoyl-tripeptide--D-alanyl-D-alanine ligase [Paenibacillus sp. 1P07SE]|uniref:UDP-N-acetylmuramoyl-tripeptide--D-alanyl-D- alanine ligase n=1 Tax=Paenibacillus sp. 1P07SE TaxID=3132209 RepID=UPI0039A5EF52